MHLQNLKQGDLLYMQIDGRLPPTITWRLPTDSHSELFLLPQINERNSIGRELSQDLGTLPSGQYLPGPAGGGEDISPSGVRGHLHTTTTALYLQ